MAADSYQIVIGWDHVSTLATVENATLKIYSPRAVQVTPGRVVRLLDGSSRADGHYLTTWTYDDYITGVRLEWLLTTFGIDVNESAEVTVCTPGRTRNFEYWNAIIYRPDSEYHYGRFAETVFPLALWEYLPSSYSSGFNQGFA